MAPTTLERNRYSGTHASERRADWIRLETTRLVEIAGSGHYSSVFSCAELFAVDRHLFHDQLRTG